MITSMLAATRVDVKNPKIFVEISFVSAEFQSRKNLSIYYCTESSLGSGCFRWTKSTAASRDNPCHGSSSV